LADVAVVSCDAQQRRTNTEVANYAGTQNATLPQQRTGSV